MAFIEFQKVNKIYQSGDVKVHALKDACFQIEKGEICVIVGGSLTPKIPQSLDRLIFLCQIYFYILRTIVLYGIMYLYTYNT